MLFHLNFKYCLLIFTLLITACSRDVTFVAKEGDEARYWVYTHADIKFGYRTETQSTQSLMHYRIGEVGDSIKMHVKPDYIQLSSGNHKVSSFEVSSSNADFQQLYSSGFDVTVDKESGELLELKGRDEQAWQKFLERGGQQFVDSLQQGMNTPGLLSSIPAKAGSVVSLPDFNGQAAQLTVQSVTDTSLSAIIESQSIDGRLYGKVSIDRDSGWVQKLMVVVESSVEIMDREGNSRVTIIMTPENEPFSSFGVFDDAQIYDELYNSWNDIAQWPDDWQQELEEVSAADVFAYEKGMFKPSDQGYKFTFLHQLAEKMSLGHMTYQNIEGFDKDGQPLDIDFSPLDNAYFSSFRSQYMESHASVAPLGWGKQALFEQLSKITATADYFPAEITPYPVTWQPGKTQTFELGAIKVQVTPKQDAPGEYLLTYSDTEDSWLIPEFNGINGQFKYPKVGTGPEWLEDSLRGFFVNFIGPEKITQTIELKVAEEPSEVIFLVKTSDKHPQFSKQVELISEKEFAATPTLPPISDQRWISIASIDNQQTTDDFNLDSLVIETDTAQEARVALPKEWSEVCQLHVEGDIEINRHPLTWQALKNDSYGKKSSLIEYQLMTDDGVRRYFYDLEVNSRLNCQGEPKWQELAHTPNEFPWLVPIDALDGVDSKQPVAALLNNYRFYNSEGLPLQLVNMEGHLVSENAEMTVSQILYDGQYIKLAGSVSAIAKLNLVGEPQSKTWTNHFPPVPKG